VARAIHNLKQAPCTQATYGVNRRHKALLAVKIAITLALLVYIVRRLHWADVGRILSEVRPWLYLPAVLVLGVSYALVTLRWRTLLAGQDLVLRYRSALSIDLVAAFLNSFLPGSTGGDAARVYYASRVFPGEVTRLVATALFDRALGLFVLLSMGYAAFLLRPAIVAGNKPLLRLLTVLPPLLTCGAIAATLLLFLPRGKLPSALRRLLERAAHVRIASRLLLFAQGLRRHPEYLMLGIACSLLAQLAGFLAAHLSARALGIPLDYFEIALILAIVQTAVSLPISIGGHGVREVVLIAMFSAMGVAQGHPETAVAFSVLLVLAQLSWSLVGGLWFAARPRHMTHVDLRQGK